MKQLRKLMKNIGIKMEIINTKDLAKIYHLDKIEAPALKKADISINKGEIAMILGPSGSGKSTLLHLLGALDKPSKGNITIKNTNITELDDFSLAVFRRYYFGFVFQSFNLIPTLNVLENVLVPTIPDNTSEKKTKTALEILKLVGLENRVNHKPNELSGGERQRVSIARALINNPEIVFADEPTGNLDSKNATNIIELIKKLRDEKKTTFVVVTHDPNLTIYADKIIYIKDGLIDKVETKHKIK
jgi:putative ABC transport system ATP-binding protein